jgi:pimeloyl-ACP methyl ester carboxylesterase
VIGLHTLQLSATGRLRGTIVALPGLMESVASMQPTLQHWASRGFAVIGIDPRGHANSPRWSDELLRRHPGDVIVEDILTALDRAPVDPDVPLVLFGHSAGGAAAASVAARLTGRVRAVLLEDPFWRLPVTQLQDAAAARRATAELTRLKAMQAADRVAEIRAVFPSWPDDELAAWAVAKDDTDLSIIANGHVIPSRGWPTVVAELVAANVPIGVVTGTIRIGMTANHRAILRALGAEVIVVRGATHFIRRDARDLFHSLSDDFLDRHVPCADMAGQPRRPQQLQPLGGPSWPK